jgi:hypothetical protein
VRRPALLVAALAVLAAAGCGGSHGGLGGSTGGAGPALGFPGLATKNTTRIAGADPVADAAAVAEAVFPATAPGSRPGAVALLDARDWRAALVGAVLAAPPIRAGLLLSDGPDLPAASARALRALAPRGASAARGVQLLRVGDVARPAGLRSADVVGRDPFALARALDAVQTAARGRPSAEVVVASADAPAYAMPAAAWAAKSGDPVLLTRRDRLPADTRAALAAHRRPRIYVLGPPAAVSDAVMEELRRLGTVTRVGAPDPVANAIAFARFRDRSFGWGVVDPGHGLVFARADRPLDAAAAALLSTSGTYGPLLLLDGPARLAGPVADYLLDIQPGYAGDPVRGVYNHGWIVGDDRAVAVAVQARIDALLEIKPIDQP